MLSFNAVTGMVTCLYSVIWIVILSMMIRNHNRNLSTAEGLTPEHLMQIKSDWTTPPFVDVELITGSAKCPSSYPDEVFYEVWPGAELFCDCIEAFKEEMLYTRHPTYPAMIGLTCE